MSIIQGAGEGRGRKGRVLSGEGYHSSVRDMSGIHEPIMPSITILQQSREVVWRASLVSTELVDIGDCRVTNPPSTTAR